MEVPLAIPYDQEVHDGLLFMSEFFSVFMRILIVFSVPCLFFSFIFPWGRRDIPSGQT